MRFTPHGQREMIIGTLVVCALAVLFGFLHVPLLSLLLLPILVWLFAFFRDPDRPITEDAAAMVSPADGVVSDVSEIDACDLVGGEPAVRIGIFLSVFNVHVNRAPCAGVVSAITYKKGKFINAMSHSAASSDNESNSIVMLEPGTERPVAAVKQIVGLIARRIICSVKLGDAVGRGDRIGMIKFGSRTELYIPKRLEPQALAKVGDKVQGALTILATVNKRIVPVPVARPVPKHPPLSTDPIPLDD